MLFTRPMQARAGFVSEECKLLFKMDERSGLPRDTISGATYDPLSVGSGGGIDFVSDNAIRLSNNDEQLPTPLEHNLTLNTRKVIILAAHVNVFDALGTRVNLGVAGLSNVLSLSLKGSMHLSFEVANEGLTSVTTTGQGLLLPVDADFTIYAMWDGTTNTLSGKALNTDGSVYTPVATPYALSQVITAPTSDIFSPGNESRLTGADYYEIGLWQCDEVPNNLDYNLAQWGAHARAGHKSAPDL